MFHNFAFTNPSGSSENSSIYLLSFLSANRYTAGQRTVPQIFSLTASKEKLFLCNMNLRGYQ